MLTLGLLGGCGRPDVVIELQLPKTVQVDDQFHIDLMVANREPHVVGLRSVDIGAPAISGFRYISSEPLAATEEVLPLDGRSLPFNLAIEPGERVRLRITAVANTAGVFHSSLDVCVDADVNCYFHSIQIEAR